MNKNYLGLATTVAILSLSGYSTLASADWMYGIGTGMSRLDIDGTLGVNTNLAGPQSLKVKLDPSDIDDLMDTAFGFGGYATDGKWLITYAYGSMNLGGDENNETITADLDFKLTNAEVMVGYPVYGSPDVRVGVIGGAIYTEHDSTFNLYSAGERNHKKNAWTDAAIGLTVDVPINEKWTWANMARGEFGGSEGGYTAKTGVNWAINKAWSTSLSYKYQEVDFENGSEGDSTWYHYDFEHSTASLSFLYNW